MNSLTVSLVVFACIFSGALLGMLLRATLPEHHLGSDSKDIVKLGMGLVGTMAALVLGLLVASAKGSFDVQSTELTQMAANVGLLDRALAQYGPETKEARDMLRVVVARLLDEIWSKDRAGPAPLDPSSVSGWAFFEKIQGLSPSKLVFYFDQMGMLARDQNGGPNFNAKVKTVAAISEFVGAYRILGDAPAEQGTGLSSFWLEPLFGVRYYYDHNKFDVRVVQQTTDFDGARQWADPYLGGRLGFQIWEHFWWTFLGDVAPFGTGSEPGAWEIESTFRHKLPWSYCGIDFDILAGYRLLHFDRKPGNNEEIDLTFRGPVIAFGARF